MGYRGRDLDLRTPEQARTGRAQTWSSTPAAARADNVYVVDDAVLACCNHAYDLAVAHRASEVGLEHLLNAMARTDAASAALAALGIDVAGLRHDTASIIAGDEAMLSDNENLSPRRSQDLADTLTLAASRAAARRAAVSVADVLHALFELNREQPGLVMLKRNAPGWQQRPFAEQQRPEPLPPLLGGGYQGEMRYVAPEARAVEPPREWVSVPQPTYYPAPPTGYYVAQQPAPQPAPVVGTMTDAVQNSRLDQLERTIRDLSGELSAERKAFSQLVGELKRDVISHTDTTSRMRGGLDDRLAGIEQMVMSARTDGPGAGPQMSDRLASLERNVDAKFGDLARVWNVLGERLQSLEAAVTNGQGDSAMPDGLADRLQGIDDLGRTLATFAERMSGIERQLAARSTGGAVVNLQPIVERLDAIEQAQQLRPAATSAALSPVVDRLQAMDARLVELSRKFETTGTGSDRTTSQLAERLRSIEDAMVAQRNQVAQVATGLNADFKALANTVGQASNAQGEAGERIQALTSSFERQRGDLAASIGQPVTERLGALEKQLQGFGQRTLDLHAAHGKDLVELHEAMVKLNANQQALAGSLDQWRLENGTELGALGSRLDGMERTSLKPMQLLESLQANVQTLQRTTAKRDEQRSRFRTWLMGTDDWYGASWEHAHGRGEAAPRTSNGTASTAARPAVSPPRPAVQPGTSSTRG
jgi:Clp amino terminal domain, pathogenicity island component